MKVIINTDKAPSAIGPYSQGFIFNGLVFTSGQLPLYPKTMNLTEGGIKEQTWQALLNLKFVLEMGELRLKPFLKQLVSLRIWMISTRSMKYTKPFLVKLTDQLVHAYRLKKFLKMLW